MSESEASSRAGRSRAGWAGAGAGAGAEENWRRLTSEISAGRFKAAVLAQREGRVTVRARPGGEGWNEALGLGDASVIVKLWHLGSLRDRLRRLMRWTKARCEWAALRRLSETRVRVPRAHALVRLRGPDVRQHEALVLEDLSPCVSLAHHLHELVKTGAIEEAQRLRDEVIDYTAALLRHGVMDNDHRLGNFLLSESAGLSRIDFENARLARPGRLPAASTGDMLGALMSSYAWVTRPAPDMAEEFTQRLLAAVRPSEAAVRRARSAAEAWVRRQHEKTGEIGLLKF